MLKHSAASEHTRQTSVMGIRSATFTQTKLPHMRNPTENLLSNDCSLSAVLLAKRFVYHFIFFFLFCEIRATALL